MLSKELMTEPLANSPRSELITLSPGTYTSIQRLGPAPISISYVERCYQYFLSLLYIYLLTKANAKH